MQIELYLSASNANIPSMGASLARDFIRIYWSHPVVMAKGSVDSLKGHVYRQSCNTHERTNDELDAFASHVTSVDEV
jgi:hypothetical protein